MNIGAVIFMVFLFVLVGLLWTNRGTETVVLRDFTDLLGGGSGGDGGDTEEGSENERRRI